jgi:hypothetical protein
MNGIGQFATDNSDSLVGMGLGMMAAPGMGGALAGYTSGAKQDMVRRKLKYEQDQELAKQAAAKQLAVKYNIPAELATDPDQVFALAKAVEIQKRTPREDTAEVKNYKYAQANPGFADFQSGKAGEQRNYTARVKIAQERGLDPKDPATMDYILTGKRPGADNKVLAGDRKEVYEAEDNNTNLASTIQALGEAKKLNDQTFVGYGAGARAAIGTKLPDGMVPDFIADPQTAKTTAAWQNIMKPEAIKTMASTLKGATTDFELNTFVDLLSDPSTEPSVRKETINRMMTLAMRKQKLNNERVKNISGGTYFKMRANEGGPQGPAAAAAGPQIIKHPSGATIEEIFP